MSAALRLLAGDCYQSRSTISDEVLLAVVAAGDDVQGVELCSRNLGVICSHEVSPLSTLLSPTHPAPSRLKAQCTSARSGLNAEKLADFHTSAT